MLELIMYCIDYSDDENMGTSNDAQTELREDLLSLKNKVGQIQKDLINGKFIEKVKMRKFNTLQLINLFIYVVHNIIKKK